MADYEGSLYEDTSLTQEVCVLLRYAPAALAVPQSSMPGLALEITEHRRQAAEEAAGSNAATHGAELTADACVNPTGLLGRHLVLL